MNAQQVASEIEQDKSGAKVFAWFFLSIAAWAVVGVIVCN